MIWFASSQLIPLSALTTIVEPLWPLATFGCTWIVPSFFLPQDLCTGLFIQLPNSSPSDLILTSGLSHYYLFSLPKHTHSQAVFYFSLFIPHPPVSFLHNMRHFVIILFVHLLVFSHPPSLEDKPPPHPGKKPCLFYSPVCPQHLVRCLPPSLSLCSGSIPGVRGWWQMKGWMSWFAHVFIPISANTEELLETSRELGAWREEGNERCYLGRMGVF